MLSARTAGWTSGGAGVQACWTEISAFSPFVNSSGGVAFLGVVLGSRVCGFVGPSGIICAATSQGSRRLS